MNSFDFLSKSQNDSSNFFNRTNRNNNLNNLKTNYTLRSLDFDKTLSNLDFLNKTPKKKLNFFNGLNNYLFNNEIDKKFQKDKGELFKSKLFNKNLNRSLFNNSNLFKIKKKVSFFSQENIHHSRKKELENELFHSKKIQLGTEKIKKYKKDINNTLSVFNNYKPQKRYYVSNLRYLDGIFNNNNDNSNDRKKNILFSYNQKNFLNNYGNSNYNKNDLYKL